MPRADPILPRRFITDRGDAFNGFTAAEEFARALLPYVPNAAVLICDRRFRLRMAEGPALPQGGRASAETVGRQLGDLLPADEWTYLRPRYERVLDGKPARFVLGAPSQRRSYRSMRLRSRAPKARSSAP